MKCKLEDKLLSTFLPNRLVSEQNIQSPKTPHTCPTIVLYVPKGSGQNQLKLNTTENRTFLTTNTGRYTRQIFLLVCKISTYFTKDFMVQYHTSKTMNTTGLPHNLKKNQNTTLQTLKLYILNLTKKNRSICLYMHRLKQKLVKLVPVVNTREREGSIRAGRRFALRSKFTRLNHLNSLHTYSIFCFHILSL